MAQDPNRNYDKTDLSVDQAEERGFLHRDYASHCFRWSHIIKWMMTQHRYKDVHILDVGCGRDLPLPRSMYANKMSGFDYSGIDVNRLEFHPTLVTAHNNGKARISLHEECDASLLPPDELAWGLGNVLVSLECLEHMQPHIVCRMLQNWKRLLVPGATLFVSTPVFNGSAAANHVSEWSRQTLGTAFEYHGFTIEANYGTFASKSDLMNVMTAEEKSVYDRLGAYYESNVQSLIMAPLHPEASRNNLWRLRNTPSDPNVLRFWNEDGTVEFGIDQNPNAQEIIHGKGL